MANYFLQAMLHKEICVAGYCQNTFAETWEVLHSFSTINPPKEQAENWYPCTAADIMELGVLENNAQVFHTLPPFIYAEICREKENFLTYVFALDTSYRLWLY